MSGQTELPYGRHWVDEEDIRAVVQVLKSDWITTGPTVESFEEALTEAVGAQHGIAVSSGTAALHTAMHAASVGPGDEVIVPPITFVATANAVTFQGARPVFADVNPETLLIDPSKVEESITPRTKAIVSVDYAGHPCDYDSLRDIADRHGLVLISDACHALGARYRGRSVGTLADLTVFSFHPVKHITTGEGGMVVTDDPRLEERARPFRNHGIATDHRQRAKMGTWFYEMRGLGFNYRLSDLQCALGLSQLRKLPRWLERRRKIAATYDVAFADRPGWKPLMVLPWVSHAYHLYVVRIDSGTLNRDRDSILRELRGRGIGANVHYFPVHLQPFYRREFGCHPGLCPASEEACANLISLPIFPAMTDKDVEHVTTTVTSLE